MTNELLIYLLALVVDGPQLLFHISIFLLQNGMVKHLDGDNPCEKENSEL